MKKIIRLTERDLTKLVKRIILETEEETKEGFFSNMGKTARKWLGSDDRELEIWFSDADSEIASENKPNSKNDYTYPAYYGDFDSLEAGLQEKVLDLFYDCKENYGEKEGYQEFKNGLDRLYNEYGVKK